MNLIDDKTMKGIQSRVKSYLSNGIVKTRQSKEHVAFFVENANNSLDSASTLFDLSTNRELLDRIGRTKLNGFLWVINASYYSMFYMARALIEDEGIKIHTDLSIHMVTFDVLVHFFYQNGKLQKKIIEDYFDAKAEVDELLGKQKADELIADYFSEKKKRSTFTYETGVFAIQSKAKTSLDRAKKFNQELIRLIKTDIQRQQ
jgi:uncharacterized protein (UPF0332 family)